ncbi:MAG: hypothetical protein HFJ55_01140 [Clostridia bacterium]|nr:hypothetical protein [Clostridia bacterium]
MRCNIRYIEDNDGLDYWCLTHKAKANVIDGQRPSCCDCKYKERYKNIVEMEIEDIENIKIIYPNLNKNNNVKIYINGQEFNGIMKLESSIIDLKDYGGLMLSKLNNIELKASKCPYCGGMHTDNGMFAYKPHSEHLCIYCGHFYKVEEANIGNELALYFDFPNIDLEENAVSIDEKCEVIYDLFTGDLFVNNISCQKVQVNNKEIDVVTFLNEVLKNEY